VYKRQTVKTEPEPAATVEVEEAKEKAEEKAAVAGGGPQS